MRRGSGAGAVEHDLNNHDLYLDDYDLYLDVHDQHNAGVDNRNVSTGAGARPLPVLVVQPTTTTTTTAPTTTTTQPTTTTTTRPPLPRVSLMSSSVTVKGLHLMVPLSCSGAACTGSLDLVGKVKKKMEVLGEERTYAIGKGLDHTVTLEVEPLWKSGIRQGQHPLGQGHAERQPRGRAPDMVVTVHVS